MLRSLAQGLINLLYPPICLICKHRLTASSVDNVICTGCFRKIKRNLPPFCYRCGRQLKPPYITKHFCGGCLKRQLHFDRAFSPCAYEGVMKELIHHFKYRNRDYLGATLSKIMIEFIREYDFPIDFLDLIIPVPLTSAKLREREFNQAHILSAHIAAAFNKKALDNTLIRHRHTKTQTDLDPKERLENVKESFSLESKESIQGINILLVDDVLTTGATASEATQVLKNAGARIVFVLTLAN